MARLDGMEGLLDFPVRANMGHYQSTRCLYSRDNLFMVYLKTFDFPRLLRLNFARQYGRRRAFHAARASVGFSVSVCCGRFASLFKHDDTYNYNIWSSAALNGIKISLLSRFSLCSRHISVISFGAL